MIREEITSIGQCVLAEYVRHYNDHRLHQALRQESPLREPGQTVDITARIERRQILGGLVSEYRKAAWAAGRAGRWAFAAGKTLTATAQPGGR